MNAGAGELVDRSYASLSLLADAGSARQARAFVQRTLAGWNLEALIEDACLCVSELVTNAVLHAGTEHSLVLHIEPDGLYIEVRDRRPVDPNELRRAVEHPGFDSEEAMRTTGRGLLITAAVSDDWGIDSDRAGKTLWCRIGHRDQLPTTEPSAPRLVRLLDLPVALALANGAYCEDLLREVQLGLLGRSPAAVPRDLAESLVEVMRRSARGRLTGRNQARAAAAAGLTHYTAEVRLRPEDAHQVRQLDQIIDRVGSYCDPAMVLLPAPPDLLRRYREWIAEEIGCQLAGQPARPCPL
jgi:anti-sigma regulatory factor (Ser/Thr protein kinase)